MRTSCEIASFGVKSSTRCVREYLWAPARFGGNAARCEPPVDRRVLPRTYLTSAGACIPSLLPLRCKLVASLSFTMPSSSSCGVTLSGKHLAFHPRMGLSQAGRLCSAHGSPPPPPESFKTSSKHPSRALPHLGE